jgi:hypothetical protein
MSYIMSCCRSQLGDVTFSSLTDEYHTIVQAVLFLQVQLLGERPRFRTSIEFRNCNFSSSHLHLGIGLGSPAFYAS